MARAGLGVELVGERVIRATSELMLSSRAIGSPRFLLLSGVGPADHLQGLGIPAVFDQPDVGAKLQDHLDLFVIAECTGQHTYDRIANTASVGAGEVAISADAAWPRSRSTVRLESADLMATPLIDPQHWADLHDRKVSIRGLRTAQQICSRTR